MPTSWQMKDTNRKIILIKEEAIEDIEFLLLADLSHVAYERVLNFSGPFQCTKRIVFGLFL